MVLWIDLKQRTYGLEEEMGYADLESKSVEFTLHEDLDLEVVRNNLNPVLNVNPIAAARAATQARLTPSRRAHQNLPAIHFDPDGSFGETSPPALRVFDHDGHSLWLAQSRTRLDYEIRSDTNQVDEATP